MVMLRVKSEKAEGILAAWQEGEFISFQFVHTGNEHTAVALTQPISGWDGIPVSSEVTDKLKDFIDALVAEKESKE